MPDRGQAEDGREALEAQLRAPAPAGLVQALSEPQLHELADAVAEARRRQAAELAAAGERAYGHIPRLLRAPIRKALG